MKTLSIIIPAYNEHATILKVLEQIAAQSIDGVQFEVIVIDDGSSDGTAELVESRPDLHNHLVRQHPNQGKGAAVRAGLQKAGGDFVLFQDADLEYSPGDYPAMLLPVLTFDADIVIGSRFMAPRYSRVHYFWHKIGNGFITLLFNILYNTTFSDIYSCYLMYRRDLVEPAKLAADGWDQHAEILAVATKKAEVIYEVPISYHGRSYAEGKKIKAHHVFGVIWMIIKKRFG
jgi:glycosyltransferase involved in cell wall biosynthesis